MRFMHNFVTCCVCVGPTVTTVHSTPSLVYCQMVWKEVGRSLGRDLPIIVCPLHCLLCSPVHKSWATASFPPAPTSQPPPIPHNVRREHHPSLLMDHRSSPSDHHQYHPSNHRSFSAGQRMVGGGTHNAGTVVMGSDHMSSRIPAPRGTKQMTSTGSQKLGVTDARRKPNSSLVLSPPVSSPSSSSSSSESSSTTPTNELGERGSPAGASSSSIASMASHLSKPEPGQSSGSNSSTPSPSPSHPLTHSESVGMPRHHEAQPPHSRSSQREDLKSKILYSRPLTKNNAQHYEARYTHSHPIRDDLQSSSSDTSLLHHQRQKITTTTGLQRAGSAGESRTVQPSYRWGHFKQKPASVVAKRIAQFNNPPPIMAGSRLTRSTEEGRSTEGHGIAAAECRSPMQSGSNVVMVSERKMPEGVSRSQEGTKSPDGVMKTGRKRVAESQNRQQRIDHRKISDSHVMQLKASEKHSADQRRGSDSVTDQKNGLEGCTEWRREPENVRSESPRGSEVHGYHTTEQHQQQQVPEGPLLVMNDRGNDSHSRATEERRTAGPASFQDTTQSKLQGKAQVRHQKQQEMEEIYQQQQMLHTTSREDSLSPTSSVEELSLINQAQENPDGWVGPPRMHQELPQPTSAPFLSHQTPSSHPHPTPHGRMYASSQGQHGASGASYVTHGQVVPGPHHAYPGMPPLPTHPAPYPNPHQLYQQPTQLPPGIPYPVEQLERRDHYPKVLSSST